MKINHTIEVNLEEKYIMGLILKDLNEQGIYLNPTGAVSLEKYYQTYVLKQTFSVDD